MRISCFVIGVHILALALCFYFHARITKTIPHRPLLVNTHYSLPENDRIAKAAPLKPAEVKPPDEPGQQTAQHPYITPLPPRTMKPRSTPHANQPLKDPTPVPNVKPGYKQKHDNPDLRPHLQETTQNKIKPTHDQLVALAKQSLQTLSSSTTAGQQTKSPKKIQALASEQLSFEKSYEEKLICYLESLLTLPEKGEVKLKLVLKKDGIIEKLTIVNSTSEKNQEYIENALAACSLPAFGSYFKGEIAHTFTLTLTSGKFSLN